MIQARESNIEPDGPEMTPEFVYDLLVHATVMWLCVRRGSVADLRKEMRNCVKDAHIRMGTMLATLRGRADND